MERRSFQDTDKTSGKSYSRNTKDSSRKKNRRPSRKRSASLPAFDKHSKPKGTERTRSHSVSSQKKNNSTRKTWYEGGFPALRIANKKIRELRKRSEVEEVKEQHDTRRRRSRSDSFNRGRSNSRGSIFSADDGETIPSYRSKPVRAKSRARQEVINRTYTGDETSFRSRSGASSRSRSRSRRNSIVQKKVESVLPYMREGYTINDLQADIYQQVHNTYGATDTKQKQFYERLAKIQLEHYRMRYMKLNDKDRIILEEKFKQFEKINSLMSKYENESVERYMTESKDSTLIDAKFNKIASKGLLADTATFQRQQKRGMVKLRTLGKQRTASTKLSYNTLPSQYHYRQEMDRSRGHTRHREQHKNFPNQVTGSKDMLALMKEAEKMLAVRDNKSAYERLTNPVYHVKRKDEYMNNGVPNRRRILNTLGPVIVTPSAESNYQYMNNGVPNRRRTLNTLGPVIATPSAESNYHHQTILQARQKLYVESRNRRINRGLSETKRSTYGGYERRKTQTLAK